MSTDRPDDLPNPPEPDGRDPVRPTAPFARAPVQWGRPPQVVFQAGPLPRGQRLDPLPEPPKAAAPRPVARPAPSFGGSIHSGSMIPRARPPATGPVPGTVAPQSKPQPRALAPEQPRTLTSATPIAATPTVAPQPRPEPRPEPVVASSPILEATAPVVDVSPEPARRRVAAARRSSGRMPLYAGIAAAAVVGVATVGWFATRPEAPADVASGVSDASPPVEAVPLQPATETTPTVTEVAPAASEQTASLVVTDTPSSRATARSMPSSSCCPISGCSWRSHASWS